MHYLLFFLLLGCLNNSEDKHGSINEKEIFNTWYKSGSTGVESWTLSSDSTDSTKGVIWSYQCPNESDPCYKIRNWVTARFHLEGDSLIIEYDLTNIRKYLIAKLTKDEMILKPIQPEGKGYIEYVHRERVLVDTLSNE